MKYIINKAKSVFANRPNNALLMALTGFLFTQVMLLNVLHSKHPQGGWATEMGTITTHSILMVSLAALSICLVALWRSVDKIEISQEPMPAI